MSDTEGPTDHQQEHTRSLHGEAHQLNAQASWITRSLLHALRQMPWRRKLRICTDAPGLSTNRATKQSTISRVAKVSTG